VRAEAFGRVKFHSNFSLLKLLSSFSWEKTMFLRQLDNFSTIVEIYNSGHFLTAFHQKT
jgi:hypothetical protein